MGANWYDHAEIYDIAFGWDAGPECEFLAALFARYAKRPVRRIYEPFCGSGRLLVPLAQRGFALVGADTNSHMLAYLRQRLAVAMLRADVVEADVADWQPNEPVDAVVTLIDSFRHLLTAAAATAALGNFQAALVPGGLLIIGLQLGAASAELVDDPSWQMERDGRIVTTAVFGLNAPGPIAGTELMRSVLHVTEPDGRTHEIRTDEPMRVYTRQGLIELAQAAGPFEFLAAYDYHDLEIEHPTNEDDPDGNTVMVFRRP